MTRFFIRAFVTSLAITVLSFASLIPAAEAEESNLVDHVVLRYGELDGMWADIVANAGVAYVSPDVVIVLGSELGVSDGTVGEHIDLAVEPVQTSYGSINDDLFKSMYDIQTHTIYLTYQDIDNQWTNFGDFAVSFLIAHEWGHHISNLMYYPDFQGLFNVGNANKTFFELQADCYSGLYAKSVADWGGLEAGDFTEAQSWTSVIGSDVGGNTDTSTWTHGSSAQREQAFLHGYSTNQCEAYSGVSGAPLTNVQEIDCARNPIALPCEEQATGASNNQNANGEWAAGWYDPYGYGCVYWYDGTQYSQYVDCDGDGYADSTETGSNVVGWYGPYSDGCHYWWDGIQYTGHVDCNGDGYADEGISSGQPIDCPHNVIAVPCEEQVNTDAGSTAGWYGPYSDGCHYWWDGIQYTGHVDCNGDGYADEGISDAGSASWYGPQSDGCNYWWDGTQYTGHVDCNGDGYAD